MFHGAVSITGGKWSYKRDRSQTTNTQEGEVTSVFPERPFTEKDRQMIRDYLRDKMQGLSPSTD